MKINNTRTVTGDLGSLQTHRVNIAANGKAFSTLVKGIYENKIRAFVREISTNALDSHIQAGIPDTPFHVSFPDILDPYFRVRDYGVSMDHETVFNVFGTLFESTKDDSNDVVGAFGLGSKSPLAYADSFNVSAYLDGEVRVYLVSIDETGAPTISLISQSATDKPNGIEVAVPIRESDFGRVVDEGRSVLSAFDVTPTNNINVEPIDRIFSTDDNSAFVIRSHGSRVFVRQGCVMYPVNDWEITRHVNDIKYNYALVLDVPIGTVGVTTSREALELDEPTRNSLCNLIESAVINIGMQIQEEISSKSNFLEATRFAAGNKVHDFWNKPYNYKGKPVNGWLDFRPEKMGMSKGWRKRINELTPKVKFGTRRELTTLTRMNISDVKNCLFVCEYTNRKVVRSNLRYREAVANNGKDYTYLLTDPTPKLIERLIRVLGVKSDQIIWVGSLEDPGPAKRGERRNSTADVSGVTEPGAWEPVKVTEIPEEYYWVEVTRPKHYEMQQIKNKRAEVIDLGGDVIPVLMFSPTAVKRYKPSPEFNLYNVFKELISDRSEELKDALKLNLAVANIDASVLTAIGIKRPSHTDVEHAIQLLNSTEINTLQEEADKFRAELKSQYPMLIDPDEQDILNYVKERQDTETP